MTHRRFDAQAIALELIGALAPVVTAIAKHDRDLAQQIRRSASSVPLNVSEGNQRRGADRFQHFRIAAGSAAEARTALDVACGWGYADARSVAATRELLDRVVAMLWRLTNGRP